MSSPHSRAAVCSPSRSISERSDGPYRSYADQASTVMVDAEAVELAILREREEEERDEVDGQLRVDFNHPASSSRKLSDLDDPVRGLQVAECPLCDGLKREG